METIITQIAEKFITNLVKSLAAGENFSEIERKVAQEIEKCAAEVTGAYLEHLDQSILADKAGRRKAGYTIERRGDERKLLTQFGEVSYRRAYYKKAAGGYEYLVDSVIEIDSRARVSEGLGLSLANAAKDMSYAKASRHIAQEMVSPATVMSRVRQSESKTAEIDGPDVYGAAHRCGRGTYYSAWREKSEVPLISVYEGIERRGKRSYCKNVFHI